MIEIGRLRVNLEEVRRRIDAAAKRAGRDPAAIRLIAATKYAGPEEIERLAECGVSEIGENRAVEALARFRQVKAILRWHMIGHLQTNKVKKALEWASEIHSVDRFAVAEELQKTLARDNKGLPCYVQVNVSGEATKGGFRSEEVKEAVARIRSLAPALQVQGLMTMAPEGEDARPHFRRLRELAQECGLAGLSMGMTQDFEVAVEEGATLLRIGSALFR